MNLKNIWPFSKLYRQGKLDGSIEKSKEIYEEQKQLRQANWEIEANTFIGKKVITISNNWDDPVVGVCVAYDDFGKGWPQRPLPKIKDALTGEYGWCGGIIMLYSENRLQTLLSMDPFTRWGLLSNNGRCFDDDAPRTRLKWEDKPLKTFEQFQAELQAIGF